MGVFKNKKIVVVNGCVGKFEIRTFDERVTHTGHCTGRDHIFLQNMERGIIRQNKPVARHVVEGGKIVLVGLSVATML